MYCRYILGAIKLINFFFKKGAIPALLKALVQAFYILFIQDLQYLSAGIGYIHIFVKPVPAQVKTLEQGLKSVGTYPGAFEKRWYRSGDPILTFKLRRFEAPRKKNARVGILTLSQRFLGLSQRFSKRQDNPIFLQWRFNSICLNS